ncbi:MAG: nickel-dependent hydrogenase large subunit, partial [Chloroflexota bacterium]
SRECVRWAATLPYPELDVDYEYVALHHPEEYGVIEGEIWSSKGSQLPIAEYERGYIEQHVKHSNALHGLLYHRYQIDAQGIVRFAKIVPPTAQNLPRIEADLFALAPSLIPMPQEAATLTAEHLVRAYDPCISCATHFLKLKIEEVKS